MIVAGIFVFKNYQSAEVYQNLAKARRLKKKVDAQQNIARQMQTYLQIGNLLEKTLEISQGDFKVKDQLIKIKETMGILAKEQKNYLLSFVLFKQCKNLGYKQADKLLRELEQGKILLKTKHSQFVVKIMGKISQNAPKDH